MTESPSTTTSSHNYLTAIKELDTLKHSLTHVERTQRGVLKMDGQKKLMEECAAFKDRMKVVLLDEIVTQALKHMEHSIDTIGHAPREDGPKGYQLIAQHVENLFYWIGFLKGYLFVQYQRFMVEKDVSKQLAQRLKVSDVDVADNDNESQK